MINLTHIRALINKEIQQILSDKSVLVVAFVIPLLLVILYGSGMRMDIKPVSVAVVSPQVDDLIGREITLAMLGSSYFKVQVVNNEIEAKRLMQQHDISAYVMIPDNLAQSAFHQSINVLIVLNGADAQQSNLAKSYIEAVLTSGTSLKALGRQVAYLSSVNQKNIASSGSYASAKVKDITVISRNWFNESNESTWYLMAGQLIGIVTLMSAFMSSIVIAREFERGTMTGILATNVNALELLISKIIPYYVLSLLGGSFAILTTFILYELPFRGSAFLFILTMAVYLYVSVLLGLLISALTQNQFLSSEYAIILSFLPSILLSGALFDLRSIPQIISYVAHMLPPTYAVQSSKICILSGGSSDILVLNLGILILFAALFTLACYLVINKHFKRYLPFNLRPSQSQSAGSGPGPGLAPSKGSAQGHSQRQGHGLGDGNGNGQDLSSQQDSASTKSDA